MKQIRHNFNNIICLHSECFMFHVVAFKCNAHTSDIHACVYVQSMYTATYVRGYLFLSQFLVSYKPLLGVPVPVLEKGWHWE